MNLDEDFEEKAAGVWNAINNEEDSFDQEWLESSNPFHPSESSEGLSFGFSGEYKHDGYICVNAPGAENEEQYVIFGLDFPAKTLRDVSEEEIPSDIDTKVHSFAYEMSISNTDTLDAIRSEVQRNFEERHYEIANGPKGHHAWEEDTEQKTLRTDAKTYIEETLSNVAKKNADGENWHDQFFNY